MKQPPYLTVATILPLTYFMVEFFSADPDYLFAFEKSWFSLGALLTLWIVSLFEDWFDSRS